MPYKILNVTNDRDLVLVIYHRAIADEFLRMQPMRTSTHISTTSTEWSHLSQRKVVPALYKPYDDLPSEIRDRCLRKTDLPTPSYREQMKEGHREKEARYRARRVMAMPSNYKEVAFQLDNEDLRVVAWFVDLSRQHKRHHGDNFLILEARKNGVRDRNVEAKQN
jgi:hypothetical protein